MADVTAHDENSINTDVTFESGDENVRRLEINNINSLLI